MDGEVGDQAPPLEVAEGPQYLSKEDEYSQRPESCKIPRPQDFLIPAEDDYSQIPPQEYEYIGRGKNVVETISHETTTECPRPSIFIDDTGVMVEELTVKSYDGSSLDIGTSNNRERMYLRRNQWHHLFHPDSDSGVENSPSDTGYRYSGQAASGAWMDIGSISFPEFLGKTSLSDDQSNVKECLTTAENKVGSSDAHGGIRTKIISKSGFSEFFVKHTLKGKGIVCNGPSSGSFCNESGDQNQVKLNISGGKHPDVSLIFGSKTSNSSSLSTDVPRSSGSDYDGVTLREWLKSKNNKASKAECLYIFRKIVDLVDSLHSQGVALCSLCPSFIKLLPLNQVMYLGLTIQKQMLDNALSRKRLSEQVILPSLDMWSRKKSCESVRDSGGWSQYTPISDLYLPTANDSKVNASGSQDYCNAFDGDFQVLECDIEKMSRIPLLANADMEKLTSASDGLEDKWYTSPEGGCTISSNIYSLGILLFELLGHFDSERAHIAAMSDLHFRILPPMFLSENPKEAGFCLWLLHPEAPLRPTTREILQSEVTNGLQEAYSEKLLSSIDQDYAESELLFHFLISLKEQKQKDASKLAEEIRCLESDAEEVERRHRSSGKYLVSSGLQNHPSHQKESKSHNKDPSSSETLPLISHVSNANELRLMRNVCQLENAYFCMRSKIQLPEASSTTHPDKDVLKNRENPYLAQNNEEEQKPTDPLGVFFDGLCKYARYSRFEVRGLLRNADFNNPANVICSLSFDRDEDYFAAAGISKKIKIFEFNGLFNDSVDIYYPVAEMPNNSKLTCVCWNNYIKNYLASTDYDGIVKLWDASTGQGFSQFAEHHRRAWSVDFSPVYPTKFASGSDDCSVKLWSISERRCLGTIRNDANVCCVQFSAHSTHFLAFGSADYMTYCYDLRNLRNPWCVLDGHEKAVSYVKFLDSETLVSASTDNTLKIWDLNKTSPVDSSTSACSLTLSGHTNEKNFVGLSVAEGYIACGSETNEVYTYYRSLPMPITSHKFGSIDPISGKETDDDNGQFVSSVCWRGKSDMVVAANSGGCIKVLQMV